MSVNVLSTMEMPTPEENAVIRTRAYLFASFSLIVAVLIMPPFAQHYRNRNIGATILVAVTIYVNLQNFVNALIWPDDNVNSWYNGIGLCDLQVKLHIWADSIFPASIFCVLRALAKVMNTKRTTWGMTQAQKTRGYVIDLVCCLGIPAFGMLFHYIVQRMRYYIYAIGGCYVDADINPVTIALILCPPIIWTLLGVYHSIIIVIRLIRYRRTFNSVLANNHTNKSRFFRLYALCSLHAFGYLPVHIYTFYLNLTAEPIQAFDWNRIHHPTTYNWDSAIKVQTHGVIQVDRWLWLGGGCLVFAFFGFGKDAMKLYRDILLVCGFGNIFPGLATTTARHRSSVTATATMSSMSSKAKMLFSRRKGSISPSTVNSFHSDTSTLVSEPSPRKYDFMQTITEDPSSSSSTSARASHHRLPLHIYPTNNFPPSSSSPRRNRSALWTRFFTTSSLFAKSSSPAPPETSSSSSRRSNSHQEEEDHFFMTQVRRGQIQSNVFAEPVSPTFFSSESSSHGSGRGKSDVVVRKEIRQNSETAVGEEEGVGI